jgi:hypothetical protein
MDQFAFGDAVGGGGGAGAAQPPMAFCATITEPPVTMAWLYKRGNKRMRPPEKDDEEEDAMDFEMQEDKKEEEEVAGRVELPAPRTDPYCYLCEVSSTTKHPNEWRDRMMAFLRANCRELDPKYLCECAVTFYNNSIARQQILARDDDDEEEEQVKPRVLLPETVYEHLTRHMIDPVFTAARTIRTLMEYDDLYTRTMCRYDDNGKEEAPNTNHVRTHLQVLKELALQAKTFQKQQQQ